MGNSLWVGVLCCIVSDRQAMAVLLVQQLQQRPSGGQGGAGEVAGGCIVYKFA